MEEDSEVIKLVAIAAMGTKQKSADEVEEEVEVDE